MSFIEAPDGSGVMVDRIIRFEALYDDLNGLLSEVRANCPGSAPMRQFRLNG